MSKYYSSSIAFGAEQTKTEQVVVSPTKIGNVTTDAVSGALTVDEVPTLDSLNPVSSDGVARAVIQAGAELPTRGSSDTGKVLTVANSDGDLEWDTPEGGIPDMTGKNGKVLGAVDNGGTMEAQWVNPPDSYPSVTGNAGKVLKVNAGATGVEWANESTATVDQNYNASSTNAQSGTAVAEALGTVKQVPAASSGDFDKILGVTDTSGTVGWVSKPASVSVDQNYNPYSDNAQSGTAVAGAIAGVKQVPASTSADENKVLSVNAQGAPEWVTPSGGAQYSAGDGIDIDGNNAISADVDGVTIGIDASTKKIKSLQVIPSKTSDLQNDSDFITSADIPAQVNADWTSNSGASEILHKPDLSIYAQSANLATVATTGSYDDLSDKPSIPAAQVNSDWNASSGVAAILNKPSLATVATTGDYSDLQNKPSIPAAQINADWNSSSGVSEILNKPTIPSGDELVPSATSVDAGKVLTVDSQGSPSWVTPSGGVTYSAGDGVDIDANNVISADVDGVTIGIDSTTKKIKSLQVIPTKTSDLTNDSNFVVASSLATVATSGNYADLSGKPTIPSVDQTYNASSTNAQSGVAVAGALATVKQVPASTSADENKVLTVNSSGNPVWETSSVPASKPLVAGSNITITDGASDVTIAATVPSVDQTYDASSANAQSGVAVASAISGINAVPASTSADQDKVLTVNSSGTPVWAAAQGGGGGSGSDSEFPYDPGYLDCGADKMVVRFGDTSYDPTTAASASHFVSITALSEPGVYEYELIQSRSDLNWSFADEWNNFSTNPVDVLYYHCSDSSNQYYRGLFIGCTGLRSVWNFRGLYSNLNYWCSGCTNLQIFSSNSKDKYDAGVASGSLPIGLEDYFIRLEGVSTATGMFFGCSSLKRVDTLFFFDGVSGGDAYDMCYDLKSLEVGPAIGGRLNNLGEAFSNCTKLIRLFSAEDFPALALMYPVIYSAPTVAASMANAFDQCYSLQDVSGLKLSNCVVSDLSEAFHNCHGLTELNCNLYLRSSGCNASRAFNGCLSLKTTPCIDYKAITDASLMFYDNSSLLDVTGLDGLAHQCTDVNYLLSGAYNVVKGVDTLYSALSSSQTIASHDGTFDNTGAFAWNNQLSQIPSSWGGTGA